MHTIWLFFMQMMICLLLLRRELRIKTPVTGMESPAPA
jgi:hypothetical protein